MIVWTDPRDIFVRAFIVGIIVTIIWISPFKPKQRPWQIVLILFIVFLVCMGGLPWPR